MIVFLLEEQRKIFDEQYGSYYNFTSEMTQRALKLKGNGWVFLAVDNKRVLNIVSTDDHINPLSIYLRPLITLCMWKNIYEVDYGTEKALYIKRFFQRLDWNYLNYMMLKNT